MDIYKIIGELIAAILVALIGYVVPKLRKWLDEKAGKECTDNLFNIIKSFVQAAEQLYASADPDGTVRKEYVKLQLKNLGIEFTDEVNAIIEGCVYELNKEKIPK